MWMWMDRWFGRVGQPEEERLRKRVVIGVHTLCIAALLQVLATFNEPLVVAMDLVHSVLLAIPIVVIFVTKRLSQTATENCIIAFGFLTFHFRDFVSYGQLDMWTLAVLQMDMLLMCNCSATAQKIVAIVSVVYIAYITVEQQYPTGVYDVLPKMSMLERKPDGCRSGEAIFIVVLVRCGSFFVDFILTRRFASAMYTEQARMRRSVEKTEEVADALVDYDLEKAEAVLEGATDLGGLDDKLWKLLDNLRSYRPYIPQALFVSKNARQQVPQGTVAMVFTEIVAMSLWKSCPSGMRKAMQTHNRVMREELRAHRGYEVKTIGDTFMVAFEDVNDAVGFCLSAQEALYRSEEWAEELLEEPLCEPVEGLWNGLRVRMGVHAGEMDMQVNPVTGRADYFGPNVNIAARVEGKAWGGTVAVTEDVYVQLYLEYLGYPALKVLGGQNLKGVREEVVLHLLAPLMLSKRLDEQAATPSWGGEEVGGGDEREGTGCCPHPLSNPMSRPAPVRGTVCNVRVDYTFLECSRDQGIKVISDVVDAVERTQGVLLTVGSSSMVAGWNLGGEVQSHATHAVRMVGLLHLTTRSTAANGYVTAGVATGDFLHGSVGTDRQRFMVGIGQTVELAGELSAAAEALSTFALVAAEPGFSSFADEHPTGGVVRAVDTWTLANGCCNVYQLRIDSVVRWIAGETEPGDLPFGWSDEYNEAFKARNRDKIQQLAKGDAVLERVATAWCLGFLQQPCVGSVCQRPKLYTSP